VFVILDVPGCLMTHVVLQAVGNLVLVGQQRFGWLIRRFIPAFNPMLNYWRVGFDREQRLPIG
jgi:hypothetical protein